MKKQVVLVMSLCFFMLAACDDKAVAPEIVDDTSKKGGQQVLNMRAHLSGDQEELANDSQATGQAIFQLSKDGTELHYKLIVANIENVHMAHIHVAPVGQSGGVVAWLYPAGPPPMLIPGTTQGILAQGTITSDDLVGSLAGMQLSDLIALMLAGNTYVNVHTMQYPGGEIRGQIRGNAPQNSW